jgi:hypothetical protein
MTHDTTRHAQVHLSRDPPVGRRGPVPPARPLLHRYAHAPIARYSLQHPGAHPTRVVCRRVCGGACVAVCGGACAVVKARTCCPGRSGSTSRTSATSSGSRTSSSPSWATTAGTPPPPQPTSPIESLLIVAVRVRWRVSCRVVSHCRMRKHRTWPDGSYYTCGLGCGMDNQPRIPGGTHSHPPTARARRQTALTARTHRTHGYGPTGCNAWLDHGHLAWIDACAHAVLSARTLLDMHQVIRDSVAGTGVRRVVGRRVVSCRACVVCRVVRVRLKERA